MIHFLKKQDRPRKFGPRRRPIRPQNRSLALSPRSHCQKQRVVGHAEAAAAVLGLRAGGMLSDCPAVAAALHQHQHPLQQSPQEGYMATTCCPVSCRPIHRSPKQSQH